MDEYAHVCRESRTVKSTLICIALTLSGDKLLVEGHLRMKLRSQLTSGVFFINNQARIVIDLLTMTLHMPPVDEEQPTGLLLTKSKLGIERVQACTR